MLTHERFCERHAAERDAETDSHRGSSSKRGYDRHHQARRRWVISRDPLCRMHLALDPPRLVPATDADHYVPKCCGGEDSTDNMWGLCHSCHSLKTNDHNRFHRGQSPMLTRVRVRNPGGGAAAATVGEWVKKSYSFCVVDRRSTNARAAEGFE